MNEEFCAGVKILLARIETNPDEFVSYGKWHSIVEALNNRVANVGNDGFVRGLTDTEIDVLHVALTKLNRASFDAYVMRELLGEHKVVSEQVKNFSHKFLTQPVKV